jgi:tape measure domain-containing protein
VAVETTTIKVVADTRDAERALGRLNTALGALVTGAAIASFARFADSVTNLQNKLSLVTQEGQSTANMFSVVAKSAVQLGVPLKDVGDLFFRVANNTKDLGLAQTDQIKITETLIKGFQLTGATAGEVAGGVVQLGQAFAVGVLRGDELNSVLESLPLVAQALAEKFGVQTGALKALGEQGRITSRDLSDAILASGVAIDQAFGNKLPTITDQFNRFQTSISLAFQQSAGGVAIGEALGLALLKITVALVKVIKFFEDWGGAIKGVISVLGALAAFSIVGRVLGAIGAGATAVAAAFRTITSSSGGILKTFEILGSNIRGLLNGVIPLGKATEVLGRRFGFLATGVGSVVKGIVSLTAAVGAFFGINKLFPKDQQDAVKTQKDLIDELNKSLGIDNVKASNQAREASAGLTAQQLKDADSLRKANIDRGISLKNILRDQNASLALGKLESTELQIQQSLNDINKQLIREIKNDKGEVIATTKGLNAEEEKMVRSLIQQNIQNGILRELKTEANRISQEANRLDILNLDLREQQAAVDAKRLQFGQLFTAEMEAQTRAMVEQQQATRNMLAVEQARRALSGTQTFGESVSRGTGVQQRMNPQGALDVQNKMDMDALKVHLDNKLITEDQYQQQLLRLKKEYANKSNELFIQQVQTERDQRQTAIQAEQQRLGKTQEQAKAYSEFMMKTEAQKAQMTIEAAGQMFSALGAQNKKAFEAAKAFNIANAIMNTYMAVTKALAVYPFPLSLVFAGGALAMGMAQVAQIRSQQYSGRALGGPVMGGQTYMVGESGPELFTPNTTGSITRNGDLGGGGAVNVTFNIQANDTSGFDDLLMSRRGLIRSVISDAMLESGRRG